jgi:ABC-type multidrug transport system fused ATPase/permease subunit
LNIQSNEKISEVIHSYREVLVRNRLGYYSREIAALRQKLAATQAELGFMPNVSKYVIETAMILSAVLVSAWLFGTQDANKAVASLAIFLATGARIVPAVLRLQQGSLQLKGSTGSGEKTLLLVKQLTKLNPVKPIVPVFTVDHRDFLGKVELHDLSFTYDSDAKFRVEEISLSVEHGSIVSIVGPSGAGKSTLVDLVLGVLEASSGKVTISGIDPRQAIERWPGAIAYVPQDIQVFSGTIKDNLLLGFAESEIEESACWEALRLAQLSDFVSELPEGLRSQVGDRGVNLSGGQRQRLGIARALITNPRLIVLDEATSALDGETELNIGEALSLLKNETTVIMIAHRLSTVRYSDVVVYLDQGTIQSVGTFEQVRKSIPNFDRQAALLGL